MSTDYEIETGRDWITIEWECGECGELNEFDNESDWATTGAGEILYTFWEVCGYCKTDQQITEGKWDTRHDPDPDFN